MAFVWTRLQRVNKRAAKFQYTASYHRIDLETSAKWKPNKLSVVWSRRSRRVVAEPLDWEPSMKEPLKGNVIWAVPDNHTIAVTLFRDQRTNELEDKDWIFILEDVSSTGRRRRIAQAPVNLRPLASIGPSQKCLSLQLRPTTAKIVSATLEVTISSVLLREGSAADEDMQSMASMMSVNNNSDIGHLEDFEEDDLSENSASMKQVLDLTQQMDLMTSSLANTPGSCASLASTPIAPIPYDLPTSTDHQTNYEQHLARKTGQLLEESNEFGNPFINPPLPIGDSFKPRNNFVPMSTNKEYGPSKRDNLKPLEFKTNLNDYKYSSDAAGDSVTPIVDVSNRDSQTMLTVRRSSSTDEGKEVTPAHDLLEWCREVTKDYKDCDVTDLSTSWTDGVAFCAIIHHFRPDLIEISSVTRADPEENIKRAFRASSQLGVPGILHSCEFRSSKGPDRLGLLTYLHQLRALFTHSQLRVDRIGQTAEESSYTIGRFNTDKDTDISVELFSQEILSMRQKRMEAQPATNRTSLSSQDSVDSQHSQDRSSLTLPGKPGHNTNSPDRTSLSGPEANLQKDKSPVGGVRDVKGMILASKNILGKVLSPTKEKLANMRSPFDRFREQSVDSKNSPKSIEVENKNQRKDSNPKPSDHIPQSMITPTVREAWPIKLMTRKQLTDPFASDDEDDDVQDVLTVRVDDSKSKQPTLEMKEEKVTEVKTEEINHPLAPASKDRDITPLSPMECLPKSTQQLLSRHDELKERARQLLEATRREAREKDAALSDSSAPSDVTANSNSSVKEQNGGSVASPNKTAEDARQAQLRERARKLIADTRAGLVNSPTSPGNRGGTVEILTAAQALAEQQIATGMTNSTISGSLDNSPARSIHSESNTNSDSENNILKRGESPENNGNVTPFRRSFESGINKSSSPLQSFANIDRKSPNKESFITRGFGKDMNDYILSEMEALEREQTAVDEQAAVMEKELRAVMESKQSDAENALMAQWFTLVNKKNALLRRQMQLNILKQESELEQRHAAVDGELRELLGVEEWRKSEGQRGKEATLLLELLTVVNARDQLVHHMHEHEQTIEDDDEIERNLSNVELQRKNNCSIQ